MKIARLPDGSPEVFRTLQGEGPSIGCPAVFLRLSLCNLHCSWCDTPYTWNWEGSPWEHQDGKKFSRAEQICELSPREVASSLCKIIQPGDRLVLTGGEPLLQQEDLVGLLAELVGDYQVEIESNGTQTPLPELDVHVAQYNISPKLANSDNELKLRIQKAALTFFAGSPKAFFKFVITRSEDLAEVLALQAEYEIPSQQILLMPEGRTPAALAEGRLELVNACLAHGFRLTDRLHVQLWGDERGR